MRVPVKWLNQYLDKPVGTTEAANAMEKAGLEIEEIVSSGEIDSRIVVGLVKEVKPHSGADKLKVTQVDAGDATYQIVCGAPNVAEGQYVPVALPGASLPDGTVIKAVKLRGEESNGMICSERELGLGDNHEGILVLSGEPELGRSFKNIVSVSDVIDTTTAANRWDLNGVSWIAHEVSAQTSRKFVQKKPEQPKGSVGSIAVEIASPKLVDRYMLAHLKVDPSRPTPEWLKQDLLAAGVRSINVVVDVTNYVMLELAQPLHAFDAAKVKLPVTVRLAKKGEKLTTLDGAVRQLDPSDLMIADAKGSIGFAGVMGGENSEVDSTTREIFLEAASFNGPTIRKTAIRHGLRTDASARFERRLPVELAPLGLNRAIELLIELADGELLAAADKLQSSPDPTVIVADPAKISALIGLDLSAVEISVQLKKLSCDVKASGQKIKVSPPWWRTDLQTEADLAEEVIKLVGFDKLPATLPPWEPQQIKFDDRWSRLWKAKAVLRSKDLFEVVTYSFISEEAVKLVGETGAHLKLANPLSSEQTYLRTSMLPSLLAVAERNRNYAREFGFYEFSSVYIPGKDGELPQESNRLAVLVRKRANSYKEIKAVLDRLAASFKVELTVKPGAGSTVRHPSRTADILIGGKQIGWLGQINPLLADRLKLGGEVGYLEVDWQQFLAAAGEFVFTQRSRFPAAERDVTIQIDRTATWAEIAATIKRAGGEDVQFVGDYYGDELPAGYKTVTFHLSLRKPDRTPTEADVSKLQERILYDLGKTFKATPR